MANKTPLERANLAIRREKNGTNNVLTDKQSKFAELVARGDSPKDAYYKTYDVGINTKQKTVETMAAKLMKNPKIQLEVERKQELLLKLESMDGISPEQRTIIDENRLEAESEWSREVAFSKFNSLLAGCDESLVLLKERPKLFTNVEILMGKVKDFMSEHGNDLDGYNDLVDCVENIEDIIYKLAKFDVKEYNSTVNTATTLLKAMNDITGVSKNASALKKESFENKLLRMVALSDGGGLRKDLEEVAFGE
jgi:hypothetical protein